MAVAIDSRRPVNLWQVTNPRVRFFPLRALESAKQENRGIMALTSAQWRLPSLNSRCI